MDVELTLEDFADFPFQDYALETEVKSEEIEQPPDDTHWSPPQNARPQRSAEVLVNSSEITQSVPRNEDNLNLFQSTPDSPELCLIINQTYQRMIVESLNKLQLALNKNQEQQAKLEEEKYLSEKLKGKRGAKSPKSLRPISLFATPYFRDMRGMVPPNNEDTEAKRKNNDVDAYLGQTKPWCLTEYDKLLISVKENIKTLMLEPLKTKRDHLKNKLKFKLLPEEEEIALKEEITNICDNIKDIKDSPVDKHIKKYEKNIDWLTISAAYMEGYRSAEECEYVWINYLNPTINKEKFTPEEDEKLSKIAEKYDYHDWDTITKKLNTNRTAIQCFERYQSYLNTDIVKKYWTEEEDDQLRNIVETLRIGDYIPWHKVVLYMDGRTRLQIMNRWVRTAAPDKRRGPWTVGEDALLIAGVKKFGHGWNRVKDFIPGRSNYLCRERYLNILAPGLKVGEWTPEEDRLLIMLARENGFGKWAKISLQIPNRTDNMCLQRAQLLKSYNPAWFFPKDGVNDYDEIRCRGRNDNRIAPTMRCKLMNNKRKKMRTDAEQRLVSALNKIMGRDDIDLNTLDMSEVSIRRMYELKRELLQDVKETSEHKSWKPRYDMFTGGERKPKYEREYDSPEELEISDASSHSEDPDASDSDESYTKEQQKYYDNILDSMLKPSVVLKQRRPPNNKPTKKRNSSNEGAEYAVLKSHFLKSYNCTAKPVCDRENIDNELDLHNLNIYGMNFAESVPRVLHCFVLPPVEPNQIPVMAANDANLTGMEIFSNVRFSVIKSAAHIEESQKLFTLLSADVFNGNEVKCLFCLNKAGGSQIPLESTTQNAYMKEMRKDFAVVDEKLKEAIAYESIKRPPPETCTCDVIKKMKKRITLLRKRFVSMFLWSWILTNTMPTDEQKDMVSKALTEYSRNYVLKKRKTDSNSSSPQKRRSKRRRKSKVIKNDISDDEFEDWINSSSSK